MCILSPGSTITQSLPVGYCSLLYTFIISPFSVLDERRQIDIKLLMISASIPLSFAQFNTHCSYSQRTIKPQQKSKCSLYVTHEQGLSCLSHVNLPMTDIFYLTSVEWAEIVIMLSKILSDSMELLHLHCFTQVMTKTQKGHKSPKAIEEIPQRSPEPLSSWSNGSTFTA